MAFAVWITGLPGSGKSTVAKADNATSTPKSEPMSLAKTAPLPISRIDSAGASPSDANTVGIGVLKAGTLKPQPLKITCPKCHHEYRIDPSRIPGGGGKFTCRNCQARIEVRPNQKADDKTASEGQKAATSRYQTPPVSQPTMPSAGILTNVTDSKSKSEEELNKSGLITGPFSIKPSFNKEIQEEEPKTSIEEKSNTSFDGESTMVMGSPPSQVKKALEAIQAEKEIQAENQDAQVEKQEAQAEKQEVQAEKQDTQAPSETGFGFSDPRETVEPVKTPSFDFTDTRKDSTKDFTAKPEAGFSFTDPVAEETAAKSEFDFSTDTTPRVAAISSDSKKGEKVEDNKVKVSDPVSTLDRTLAMNNADIASAIEARTKSNKEEISSPPAFDFNFDLTEKKPSNDETKKTDISEVEYPNSTNVIPAAQTLDILKADLKADSSANKFESPIEVTLPIVKNVVGIVDDTDRNKTLPLSPVFNFNLDSPAVEAPKEKASEPSFSFIPNDTPPVLEAPKAEAENDLTTKKVPVTLAKLGEASLAEEKRADIKIPPPPSLRGRAESKDTRDTRQTIEPTKPAPKEGIVAYSPVKTEAPRAETPIVEPPKVELPKPPKVEPPKKDPPKREEKREEIKTEDLPTPIYNPDIFSPPPLVEEPSSSRGGLFKGVLIGASVGLVLIAYLAFFRTSTTPTSSPTPTETEIVKNTPTVVETPDALPTPAEVNTPKATPSPKASQSPTPTSNTPKATPKPTDKAVTATGNLPDSASGSGKFTVQVRATQSQGEAEALGKRLRNSGAEAYVVKADLGAKGIWYRVRVGRYQSFSEAQKVGSQLKSKGSVTDFIATIY